MNDMLACKNLSHEQAAERPQHFKASAIIEYQPGRERKAQVRIFLLQLLDIHFSRAIYGSPHNYPHVETVTVLVLAGVRCWGRPRISQPAHDWLVARLPCHAMVCQWLIWISAQFGPESRLPCQLCPMLTQEGRKESLHHPWQPTRLNGWTNVQHMLCSACCAAHAAPTKLKNFVNHQSAALQTSPHRQSKQGRALCVSTTTVIKS